MNVNMNMGILCVFELKLKNLASPSRLFWLPALEQSCELLEAAHSGGSLIFVIRTPKIEYYKNILWSEFKSPYSKLFSNLYFL